MARRGKEPNREALQDLLKPIDPVSLFILSKKFVRGFRVTLEEDDSDEFEDSDLNEIGLTFESAGVNKYATITGAKSAGYWKYDTKRLQKQDSDNTAELTRNGFTESPVTHRRNKSMPLVDVPVKLKSGKGKGGGAHRNIQRSVSSSPANHLSFGDILTESDAIYSGTDRLAPSPLRSRKLQVIKPLLEEPSAKILAAAKTLYRCLIGTSTDLLRTHYIDEEKDSYFETTLPEGDVIPSYEDSMLGCELVTWLVDQMPIGGLESAEASAEKRQAACGMLQALLEEGALSHVRREHHFQDSYLLYQFHESVQRLDQSFIRNGRPMSGESTMSSAYNSDGRSITSVDTNEMDQSSLRSSRASSIQSRQAVISENMVPSIVDEQELKEVLSVLQNVAPDAMFRMVLRKLPDERTPEELMMIYEEILHIKALSHLSDSVKRELAGVLKFEFHRKSQETLFSQGDEGRSWYIIIKGSVDVDIQGQGVVCTLHEGDDFGNLAIINDAPRAATIVLAEDNCQLLRVDKHDFVRILKDVEANTVRLKEHEKDVLVLQKIHARSSSSSTGRQEKYLNNNTKPDPRVAVAATPTRNHHRYAISAGTPTKIVEHIVKSLKPWSTAKQCDEAMEDLILMYQVFMSTQDICKCLMNLYHSEKAEQIDATKSIKRKVVYFVVRWSHIATHIFYDQPAIGSFLKELKQAVQDDEKVYPTLREDLARIFVSDTSTDTTANRGWITIDSTSVNRFPNSDVPRAPHQAIKATDCVIVKVYNVNGTYTTVKLPILSTVSEIISTVAERQGRDPEELQLIQVQSDGDMYGLPKTMTSAATSLGVNSRLFACTAEEKDSISPLEEQRIVPTNNGTVLELVGSQEIAEHITQFDWELVNSIHVLEFVHKVFGSHKFQSVTSNIDVFAKRFNQLAYWPPTEICACNNVNKRVHLLRKFIKIAQHLKELQNMNAFMAVMIGLGNQAISRLHATWDKLPTKYKKLMSEFEAVLDPSRNHRAYRLHVATLRPPMIPYLPLLMKDMTFQHEGNDSKRNGLINFEKMHMMSNSIRGVVQACCKPYEMTNAVISSKSFDETRQYTRSFDVITDQKLLNSLSAKIEAKR